MKMINAVTTAITILGLASTALAGTIRVENHDSKAYTVEINCSGNHKSFKIESSTTTSYTFDSTETSCEITGGDVSFSAGKLVDGQHWKIDDGKATPN